MDSNRLKEIAEILLPHQENFNDAVDDLVESNIMNPDDVHLDLCIQFNKVIEPYIDEIARITNNSSNNLRLVFQPRTQYDVWFGYNCASYLLDVAKYRTFDYNTISRLKRGKRVI